MPYITIMQSPKHHQVSLEDILRGNVTPEQFFTWNNNSSGTVTVFRDTISEKFRRKFSIQSMIDALIVFVSKYDSLFNADRHSLYDTFVIPKRTGGLRTINAPHPELMGALRELKHIFETEMFALYHTSAFAYVKSRCPIDAIKRHQSNNSKWFEKTDFSDFFGSTTPKFIEKMLGMIFPFSEIMANDTGRMYLKKALDLCFLDNGLPQGTPISPMLTNLMMIPIDHELYNTLRKSRFVYTRYADDIQISSQYQFNPADMVKRINDTLSKFDAPFKIKDSKTRFGSSAGRNWNLGLMLNKDNQITIGYQKKKQFKAMLSNYVLDRKNNVMWEPHDIQSLRGLYAHYKSVEPEYIMHIIDAVNQKFCVDVLCMIKSDLSR